MSWNWPDEPEKKVYDTKGTVTIGTDEYRDLIEETARLRAAGQREHDDWYKEYRRADDLEKKLKAAEKRLAEIEAFFKNNCEASTKFQLWIIQTKQKESEED